MNKKMMVENFKKGKNVFIKGRRKYNDIIGLRNDPIVQFLGKKLKKHFTYELVLDYSNSYRFIDIISKYITDKSEDMKKCLIKVTGDENALGNSYFRHNGEAYNIIPGKYIIKDLFNGILVLEKKTQGYNYIRNNGFKEMKINNSWVYRFLFISINRRELKNIEENIKNIIKPESPREDCYKYDNNGTGITFKTTVNKDELFIEGIDEVEQFVNNWISKKEVYHSHKLSFKQGILLYGEQGTGKTTLSRYVSSMLAPNVILHEVNLNTNSKEELEKFVSACNSDKSDIYHVILFDDIDTALRRRDDPEITEEQEAKLNILLKFLDGNTSPDNTLFVVTTNHLERLDKAFTRDCRFDLVLEIPKMKEPTARRMIESYDLDPDEILSRDELKDGYTVANIRKACINHLK